LKNEFKQHNSTMSRLDISYTKHPSFSPAMCNNHMSHAHAGAPLALTVKRAAIPNHCMFWWDVLCFSGFGFFVRYMIVGSLDSDLGKRLASLKSLRFICDMV
jgi:hypothetical protein